MAVAEVNKQVSVVTNEDVQVRRVGWHGDLGRNGIAIEPKSP